MLKVKRIVIYLYVCFNIIYRKSNFQIKVISITIYGNEKIEIIVWDSIAINNYKNITLEEILSKNRSKVKRML